MKFKPGDLLKISYKPAGLWPLYDVEYKNRIGIKNRINHLDLFLIIENCVNFDNSHIILYKSGIYRIYGLETHSIHLKVVGD